jgi:hypothetical protein
MQEFDFVFDTDGVDFISSDGCGRRRCGDFYLGVVWDDLVVQALSVEGDICATL